MQPARLPLNETERLQALHGLMLLDTPAEERFDRVVRFAAEELGMPIALVSLIDTDRQWFKARYGMATSETPRDISFCGHAILQPELMVVEDATLDARFADNPFVTGPTHVRFYAGAPLNAPSGECVGTLCVIDTEPRRIDAMDRAVLHALRNLANEAIAGIDGDA